VTKYWNEEIRMTLNQAISSYIILVQLAQIQKDSRYSGHLHMIRIHPSDSEKQRSSHRHILIPQLPFQGYHEELNVRCRHFGCRLFHIPRLSQADLAIQGCLTLAPLHEDCRAGSTSTSAFRTCQVFIYTTNYFFLMPEIR
jgi:hypothetical protein